MKAIAVIFSLVVVASCADLDSVFYFRGVPYLVVSNEMASWFDAVTYCKARGLELCSIDTDDEFSVVRGELTSRGLQNEYVWIGGTEIGQEDNYFWVNSGDHVALDHWDIDEIVNVKNRCMTYYKGLWRHYLCSTPSYFVCESPEAPEVTTEASTAATGGRRILN